MTIFEKVKEIIVSELNVAEDIVTLDASLKDDLGADSLDAVDIVMAIEDEFGIEINNEQAESISTIADLVAYIEELKK